jgi:hypothetical protein
MITIRVADIEEDALTILDGAKDCARRHKAHEGGPDIGLLFSNDDQPLIAALSQLVAHPGLEILIAEHEGRAVGGVGILYAPYVWNADLLTGDKLFWWTDENAPFRTAMLLIEEALERIEARGAMPIFRALKTDPKGVEKLYKRFGMVPVETTYMRLP